MNSITKTRIKKEVEMLESSPPPGISCCLVDDDRLNKFSAQIMGATGTPFEGGVFTLDVQIPDRYPFEPPSIRFTTPIYHPNVDSLGRICLDTLKLPPQGSWKPHLNLAAVLMMIRVLMAEPGEEDPLMTDIWQEYKYDYMTYVANAKAWTRRHATAHTTSTRTTPDTQATSLPVPCKASADENVDPHPMTPRDGQSRKPQGAAQAVAEADGLARGFSLATTATTVRRKMAALSSVNQDDVTEPGEKRPCQMRPASDGQLIG